MTLEAVTSASKVQWILDSVGRPYIAVDTNLGIMVYPVTLSPYTFGTAFTTANLAGSNPSSFLYWLPQDSNLYLVQGYNSTNVATYLVNLTGTPTIHAGVNSDISGQFDQANSCATCSDYFVIGGSKSSVGTLVPYSISSTGTLLAGTAVTVGGASTVNYCERCCCSGDNLLVGTDTGLLSYDNSLAFMLSSTSLVSLNVCWCCNSHNQYCAVVDSVHGAFVLKQQPPSFILTSTLS